VKVYALLLRLAEESERKSVSPESPNMVEEKISEPASTAEA
jgi:hypothetical protein